MACGRPGAWHGSIYALPAVEEQPATAELCPCSTCLETCFKALQESFSADFPRMLCVHLADIHGCVLVCVHGCVLVCVHICLDTNQQAHVAPITHVDQVRAVVAVLLESNKIRNATHNIMAYRIAVPDKPGVYHQDYDDDGEAAAGGRLLHLLQVAGMLPCRPRVCRRGAVVCRVVGVGACAACCDLRLWADDIGNSMRLFCACMSVCQDAHAAAVRYSCSVFVMQMSVMQWWLCPAGLEASC